MAERITIARITTVATIDRTLARGIEATVRTDIAPTDIAPSDMALTDTDPIEADMDITAAPADIGASVSDIPAGRMVVPAVDFRFTTAANIHGHRLLRRKPVTNA